MSAREAFGLILRGAGLVLVLLAVRTAGGIMVMLTPGFSFGSMEGMGAAPFGWAALAVIVEAVLGLYLLRGAPHVVDFSYADDRVNR